MQNQDNIGRPGSVVTYNHIRDVPESLKKYWSQRKHLFSKFEDGIWMTRESFYGVTPEAVADAIASDMATYAPSQKSILIDAFSGVGGNTIAFAKSGRWEKIFAIEKDEDVMKCARHNAHVYGVADVIQFFQGDALEVLEQRLKKTAKNKKSVIFASPPWGGPDYRDVSVYDLKAMQPLNLTTLYSGFKRYTNDIALYLPRTSDLNQLAELGEDDDHFEVVHYTEWGASKAICFYSGILASPT